jgi:hypothetical protein
VVTKEFCSGEVQRLGRSGRMAELLILERVHKKRMMKVLSTEQMLPKLGSSGKLSAICHRYEVRRAAQDIVQVMSVGQKLKHRKRFKRNVLDAANRKERDME